MKKTFTKFLTLLFLCFFANNLQAEDTTLYQTGFETPDFSSSTNYSNTTEKAVGPSGQQWMIMEGAVSTTSEIAGAQSLQTRDYTTNSVTPYAYTNFNVDGVKVVNFKAKNSSGIDLIVSYSTDDGVSWLGATPYTLSTSSQDLSYTVGDGSGLDNVRLKFAVDPTSTGTSKARMYIDDVAFVGSTGPATQVALPVFAPLNGTTFTNNISVSLSSSTEGASLYYTLDGSTPTETSTLYTSAFTLAATTTVKAIAMKTGLTTSEVATATYTKVKQTPEFSSTKNRFNGKAGRNVTTAITCTSDASIQYSTVDEGVATVNASGVITLVAKGETTLNVHVDATETYDAADTSYPISVKDGPQLAANKVVVIANNIITTANVEDNWTKGSGSIYSASESIRLGSQTDCSITSTAMTEVGSVYHLSFMIATWDDDEGILDVTYDGTTKKTYTWNNSDESLKIPSYGTGSSTTASLWESVAEITFTFTATEATSIILATPTKGQRVFIHRVKLEKENPNGPPAFSGYWESGDGSSISTLYANTATATDLDFSQSEFSSDFTNEAYPAGMNPNCLVRVDQAGRFSHNNVVTSGETTVCADLELSDAQPFSGNINQATGKLTRTFNVAQTQWYTFCSPFDIDIATSPFTAVEELSAVGGSSIQFTEVTTTIEAGKAYLVSISQSATAKEIAVTGAAVSSTDQSGVLSFKPTFVTLSDAEAEGKYVLVIDPATQVPVFSRVNAGGTIPPFRCYLTIEAPASAPKSYSIYHNGEGVTGVGTVKTEVGVYAENDLLYLHTNANQLIRIYSLDGCCVRSIQAEKGETIVTGLPQGIYLIKNKKVVIK